MHGCRLIIKITNLKKLFQKMGCALGPRKRHISSIILMLKIMDLALGGATGNIELMGLYLPDI
jgi:hypothetical protein